VCWMDGTRGERDVRGRGGRVVREWGGAEGAGPRGKNRAEEVEPLNRVARAQLFTYQVLFSFSLFRV
jgi:hypothetical protein